MFAPTPGAMSEAQEFIKEICKDDVSLHQFFVAHNLNVLRDARGCSVRPSLIFDTTFSNVQKFESTLIVLIVCYQGAFLCTVFSGL